MSSHNNLITIREADPVQLFHMLSCPIAEFLPQNKPGVLLTIDDMSTTLSEQKHWILLPGLSKGFPSQ